MEKRSITTFEQAAAYLNETPRFAAKHQLKEIEGLLEKLGCAQGKMQVIHVAGTNAKGSVCAYLRCILEAAGYRTALFSSPHLTDITERFVVDGKQISREDFLRVFLIVYEKLPWEKLRAETADACHPSFFEYLFLMAMVYFQEKQPDYCILETGLGGRLDATNALAQKALCVVTPIGLDHTAYLGDTVEEIAAEKAGIFRPGVPAVCWDAGPGVREAFCRAAADIGCSLVFVSKKDYTFVNFIHKTIDFSMRTEYYGYISLTLHTAALYQMGNAALAVRAIETLDGGARITPEQIRAGLSSCFWAGRMEEVLPEVYVDGAHNADGVRAFLDSVAMDGLGPGGGLRSLLFGAAGDKDYESMIKAIARSGLFGKIAAAPLRTQRGLKPEKIKALFARCGEECAVYPDAAEALKSLLARRRPGERLYAAGSLYLAGEIKELAGNDKF